MNIKVLEDNEDCVSCEPVKIDVNEQTLQLNNHLHQHFVTLQSGFQNSDATDIYMSLKNINWIVRNYPNAVLDENIFNEFDSINIIFNCLQNPSSQILSESLRVISILISRINIDNVVEFLENHSFSQIISNILSNQNEKLFKYVIVCLNSLFTQKNVIQYLSSSININLIHKTMQKLINSSRIQEISETRSEFCKFLYNFASENLENQFAETLCEISINSIDLKLNMECDNLLIWTLIKILKQNKFLIMNCSQENTLNIIYQGLHSTYSSIKSACCAFLFNYFKNEGDVQYLNVEEIVLLLDSEPFVTSDFSCAIFCLQYFLRNTQVDLDFIANLKEKLESKYGGIYIQNALIITLIFEILNTQQISLDILIDPSKVDAFTWLERGIQYSNDEIRMGSLALCEKLFDMAESHSQLEEMRQMFFDKSINDYLDEIENEENDPELSERLDLFKSKYFDSSDN